MTTGLINRLRSYLPLGDGSLWSDFSKDIAKAADLIAELERPNFRQMREMLRAMQAGELTVSRGIEILDMWWAGNWNDDMLPPVRHDLIEEDSMPVEIIDRIAKQREELLDGLETIARMLPQIACERAQMMDYAKNVIASVKSHSKPEKPAETEVPAIVFFPYGSLGEEVEP